MKDTDYSQIAILFTMTAIMVLFSIPIAVILWLFFSTLFGTAFGAILTLFSYMVAISTFVAPLWTNE